MEDNYNLGRNIQKRSDVCRVVPLRKQQIRFAVFTVLLIYRNDSFNYFLIQTCTFLMNIQIKSDVFKFVCRHLFYFRRQQIYLSIVIICIYWMVTKKTSPIYMRPQRPNTQTFYKQFQIHLFNSVARDREDLNRKISYGYSEKNLKISNNITHIFMHKFSSALKNNKYCWNDLQERLPA